MDRNDWTRNDLLLRSRVPPGGLDDAAGAIAEEVAASHDIVAEPLLIPPEGLVVCAVARDERGFIVTGAAANGGYLLETSVPRVFAAGDVRSGSTKRCAAAVGEGAMAVQFVHARLAERAQAVGRRRAAAAR